MTWAVLYSGGLSAPLVQEYMVGPLPISSATAYTPYSYVYQNSTGGVGGSRVFPFNARYMIRVEGYSHISADPTTKLFIPTELIFSFMKPLARITQDLIGGSYTGSDDDKITYSWQGPTSFDGNWRGFWIFFTGAGNGAQYLIPTGFLAYVDVSGTDASQWSLRKIVYDNQVFTSTDAFVEAYNSGNLQRGIKPDLKDQDWSTRKKMGKARALDDRVAPRSVLFKGNRIKTDKTQQYVEWMGWSFYLGFNCDTGLKMWNIKFKSDRIIYEFGRNGQTVYLIANKNQKNQWGYPKSYRFQPGLHAVHNGARRLLSNARWGEWDLMVAKREDTEPSTSTTWSQHLPIVPPVDFSKFFDPAESIDRESLVIYANLGMHHVPRAEDTPNTLFTDTRSSFILSPFNYYDDEPPRDIRNAILLQVDKDGSYFVAEPGETEATCAPQGSFSVHYTGQVSYNT
ncbi:primary-amine oxidase [Ceratobasidium sp. AG-Ba]|nr:primary-amine oxidase [Ceratobasidium sp. AG-Ba]